MTTFAKVVPPLIMLLGLATVISQLQTLKKLTAATTRLEAVLTSGFGDGQGKRTSTTVTNRDGENTTQIPSHLNNPNCMDDPRSYPGSDEPDNICSDMGHGGEGCGKVLFTRHATPMDALGEIVITVGSRYCPQTCNAMSTCLRTREHFISMKREKSVDGLSGANVANDVPISKGDVTVHFRTFGNYVFAVARERIVKEALDTGWFKTAKYLTPDDLSIEFQEKYKDILSQSRGGGYWIWKFFVIENAMENDLSEGDFLVYQDSGSQVNRGGEKRFYEYIKMVNDSQYDMLGFQLPMIEHKWTTKRIFDAFNVTFDQSVTHDGQLEANTMLLQKGPHYRKWMELCKRIIDVDPWMLTDKYNEETKLLNPEFKENRHDQSIMSIARKKLGYVWVMGRETKFSQPDKPFHVVRKRD